MTRTEFMYALRAALLPLPQYEIDKQVNYYSELIDDMMEDGYSEAEAVAHLGSVEEIADNILQNQPLPMSERHDGERYEEHYEERYEYGEKKQRKGWTALTIVLAVLGSPLWLPLLIAAVAVVFALFVVLLAVVVSVFAVIAALILSGIPLLIIAIGSFGVSLADGLWRLGTVAIMLGVSVLLLPAVIALGRLFIRGAAAFGRWLKSLFVRKEII